MLLRRPSSSRQVIQSDFSNAVAAPKTNWHVWPLLYAAMHAHAVHYDPTATGMHDPDATGVMDAPGTDHGICVCTVDSHGRHKRSDSESSEYE